MANLFVMNLVPLRDEPSGSASA